MSSGSSPTYTTTGYYEVTPTGVDGEFTIRGYYNINYTSTDVFDGVSDDLNVLGDVPDDGFSNRFNSPISDLQYVGTTGVSGEFILRDFNSDDSYYLFTRNGDTYPSGNTIKNNGGTFVLCYCSGTAIRTTRGDVSVEALSVGDIVVTSTQQHRPIRWIGHRTMACKGRKDAMPVRIAMDAFGAGRPARDLLVSPAHAVAVDILGEVLIPACRLINGTTITQVDVEEVVYWHVELESHDIIIAEGLPAESYLDCGNRKFFTNADVIDLLTGPDTRPQDSLPFCRPFHEEGPLVELVRSRLQNQAEALGWRKANEGFAGMHIVADGRSIRPDVAGLTARFILPADARDVLLVSETSVPAHVVPGSTDDRRLGLPLAELMIDDGLTGVRTVVLDDARLGDGFYAVDGGARWTNGSAALPVDLWAGCKGSFFLRVRLARPALARWIAPSDTAGVVNLADRRKA